MEFVRKYSSKISQGCMGYGDPTAKCICPTDLCRSACMCIAQNKADMVSIVLYTFVARMVLAVHFKSVIYLIDWVSRILLDRIAHITLVLRLQVKKFIYIVNNSIMHIPSTLGYNVNAFCCLFSLHIWIHWLHSKHKAPHTPLPVSMTDGPLQHAAHMI